MGFVCFLSILACINSFLIEAARIYSTYGGTICNITTILIFLHTAAI